MIVASIYEPYRPRATIPHVVERSLGQASVRVLPQMLVVMGVDEEDAPPACP